MRLTKLEWLSLIGVVLLAALLRLGYAGVNPFASDEARLSVLALEIARDGQVIRTGIPNSAGSRNLPASVYAFVPPYLLATDPLLATQYVGLLNLVAVFSLWWLARRTFGIWSATISGLIAAAAPFAVFFSRNIWTQNLLFPMTVLWLVATTIAITSHHSRHKYIGIGLAWFIAGFAFQVHLAGATLGLATLYVTVRWQWWRKWIPVFIGGGIAALALIPFLYEAVCCSPELLSEYSTTTGESGIDSQVLLYTIQAALNRGWDYLAAGNLTQHGSAIFPQILTAVILILGMMAIAKMRWFFTRTQYIASLQTEHQRTIIELTALLLLTPTLLFTYHRAPVRLHYILTALPALAIISGASAMLLKRRIWHIATTGIAIVLVAIWSYQILSSLAIVNQQTAPQGINEPLKAPRTVAYSLPDDGRVVVMHTQSPDYYQRGEAAIWKVLLWNRPQRITNGWSVLLLPNEPSYLMTEIDGIHAWQEMRDTGIMDDNLIQYDPLLGAPPYYMQPYDGETLPPQAIMLDEPVTFDSGLQLLGWYTRHVDGQVRVSMLYQAISNPPDDASLRQFTHLRYAADVENGAMDELAYIDDIELTLSWQQGDRLIAIAAFTPSEDSGTFYVDVGQYSLNTGERYLNSTGTDTLRFGAFEWSRE
ncbi:MAG: glycosyltransferase family 39 protein [Anaerolineae bacterium]|nr:glycosyltransferase family 39 protein [Anaerolineae bacterium]